MSERATVWWAVPKRLTEFRNSPLPSILDPSVILMSLVANFSELLALLDVFWNFGRCKLLRVELNRDTIDFNNGRWYRKKPGNVDRQLHITATVNSTTLLVVS